MGSKLSSVEMVPQVDRGDRRSKVLHADDARRCTPRRFTGLLAYVLAGIAPLLATVAFAPSADAKDRAAALPNLDVTQAVASSSPKFVFPGIHATFTFEDETMNVGAAATTRASLTAYYLVPKFAAGADSYRLGARRVPSLDVGEVSRGGIRRTFSTDTLPLGAYRLQACADATELIAEQGEQNCTVAASEFYVISADWLGELSGVASTGGIAKVERWEEQSAIHLSFNRYQGDGVFVYDLSGTVGWKDRGTNIHGCIWSGEGTKALDAANATPHVRLRYSDAKVWAAVTTARFYVIDIFSTFNPICDGTTDGPIQTTFLRIPNRSLRFNQDVITGHYSDSTSTWRWTFSAF